MILSGKDLATKYKEEIKELCAKLKEENKRVPCMATILVGGDGGSLYYLNSQYKLGTSLGVEVKKYILEENYGEEKLIDLLKDLSEDNMVDGIMLQLPLPKQYNEKNILSYINPNKDIDCLVTQNIGDFYVGNYNIVPCTPRSVISLIKETKVELTGLNAVVIGRSNIVGKPVAQLLLNENCTVTICHSRTKNLQEICKNADILVSAIGKPKFVDESFVKDKAIVIDVGTSDVNGKITGDVCFEQIENKAAFVTPVPGGVGAVTTTMLIKNVCEAYLKNVY